MRARDGADPVERAAVGDHEQVVVARPGPGRSGTARRPAGRRRAAARDPCRPARPGRRSASTSRTTASVAPSVSASGFSWPTASTRRAPRSRATTVVGHGAAYGARSTRHRRPFGRGPVAPAPVCALRSDRSTPRRRPRRPCRADEIALLGGHRRLRGSRGTGVGSDSAGRGLVRRASGPPRARGGAGAPASPARRSRRGWTWSSGIRLSRSREPSSRRTNGIARSSAASVVVALGLLADDADPDLGVPEVRRRLDLRDRDEPDPRVGDLAGQDRPDLLPQQLVDALGPLVHVTGTLSRVRHSLTEV